MLPASVVDEQPRRRRTTHTWETGAEAQPSHWQGVHCSVCAQCAEAMQAAAAEEQLDAMTPLIHACLSGRTHCVQELLLECVDVDFADPDGHTALHAASAFGHKDCVELLIQAGAKLDASDNEGATPLDGARMSETESTTQIVSLLADAGELEAEPARLGAKLTVPPNAPLMPMADDTRPRRRVHQQRVSTRRLRTARSMVSDLREPASPTTQEDFAWQALSLQGADQPLFMRCIAMAG